MVTVSVSGIVGIGKSTLLKRLRHTKMLKAALPPNWHVSFVREPSKLWEERGWLSAFYGDTSHNAAAFQFQVFTTYVDAVEAKLKSDPCPPHCNTHLLIVERCMYDQRLFWEMQRDAKMATADDNYNEAYVLVWKRWRTLIPEVDCIFFLGASDMDYVMQRVQARARASEMGASFSSAEDQPLAASMVGFQFQMEPIQTVGKLTRAYQERLQQKHLEWFTQPVAHPLDAPPQGIPCLHINMDEPFHVDDGSLKALAMRMAVHIIGLATK